MILSSANCTRAPMTIAQAAPQAAHPLLTSTSTDTNCSTQPAITPKALFAFFPFAMRMPTCTPANAEKGIMIERILSRAHAEEFNHG
jgi:hypothetical protein